MKILVIGLGYVGLVTAVSFAEKGKNIIGYDENIQKIEMLKSGKPTIYENGLLELMEKNKEKILYTSDKESAYKNSNVIFICVGTPENENGTANLEYIYSVIEDIIKYVKKECIVVIKSTVPVGTNEKINKYINENTNIKIEVVSNPEFLSQGTAIKDTLEAKRIVIGTSSKWAENILKDVYSNFESSEIILTDKATAEMIKYASNNFLALKISYINEIANLCEKLGANIEDVKIGMGLDDRIGKKFLNAGIGFGGSCLPKDTKALYAQGLENGIELNTIKATIKVNEKQKIKLIDKIFKYYSSVQNLNVAVLGLAFKPETDDLREAPSLVNIKYLSANGAKIKIWDPIVKKKLEYENIAYFESIDETIENADICLIFTEWKEIKKYNIENYEKLMKKAIILDGRNCYKIEDMKNRNIIYDSIGRKCTGKLLGENI